jgi:hypothetical protein
MKPAGKVGNKNMPVSTPQGRSGQRLWGRMPWRANLPFAQESEGGFDMPTILSDFLLFLCITAFLSEILVAAASLLI